MNYLYRFLHALTVAAAFLAFGLRPEWPILPDGSQTAQESMTSRLQSWTDENLVLHGVSIPGAKKTDLDLMVLDLEGRPDVSRVTWQLDIPPWNGDPNLLEKWNELWGRNAVALIQIYPDFNNLERSTSAIDTWRHTIVSHSLIEDATQPINPLPVFELVQEAAHEMNRRYGRLRSFIWLLVFWAWIAAALARHHTSWFTVPINPVPWYGLWLGELALTGVFSYLGLLYYTRLDSVTALPLSITIMGIGFCVVAMSGAFVVDCASAWLKIPPQKISVPEPQPSEVVSTALAKGPQP